MKISISKSLTSPKGVGAAQWPAETLTIGVSSPAVGLGGGAGTYMLGGRPIGRTGSLKSFSIWAGATATVKVKRLTRSGKTFTAVASQSFSVISGLNTFTVAGGTMTAMAVEAGDFLAIYSSTANFVHYASVSAPSGTEYYANASEITTTLDVTNNAAPSDTVQLQVKFEIDVAAAASVPAVGSLFYLGEPSVSTGTGNMATTTAYFEDHLFLTDTRIETVQVGAGASGILMGIILGPGAGGFDLVRSFVINVASGTPTYSAGTDFPIDLVVPEGGMLGWWALTASAIKIDAFAGRTFRTLDGTLTPGCFPTDPLITFAATAGSTGPQIKVGLRKSEAQALSATRVDYSFTSIIHPEFTATGWSIVSGKAQNSANGLGNAIVYRRGGNYAAKTTVEFTFTGASDEIAVFRKPSGTSFGTVVTFNVSTGLLAIRQSWDGSTTLPAAQTSITVSNVTPQTGRLYRLEFDANGDSLIATLTDTVTLAQDAVTFACFNGAGTLSYAAGRAYGDPGFAAIAGTIDVSSLKFVVPVAQPRVMAFGDSITDGQGANDRATSWSGQAAAFAGSGLISAVGGVANVTWFERELRQFLPSYAIVLIGTNETVAATWKTNIDRLAEIAAAAGVDLYFGAVPAEAADSNPEVEFNPYLRLNYPTRVIDFDYALTTGGTGLGANRNASLYSDTLHPNVAGHAAMYAKVVANAPAIAA